MKRQKHKTIKLRFCLAIVFLCGGASLGPSGLLTPPQAWPAEPTPETRIETMLIQRQWPRAVTLLEKQLAVEPDNFSIQNRLLHLYLLLGNTQKASALVKTARAALPNRIEPLLLQADWTMGAFLELDLTSPNPAQARRMEGLLNEARTAFPVSRALPYLQALPALLSGDSESALNALQDYWRENPKDVIHLKYLIELNARRGNLPQATAFLTHLLETEPHSVDSLYLTGLVYIKKGKAAQGLDYLRQSEDTDPIKARAKRLLLMAETYALTGKTEQAATYYQTLLSLHPERPDYWRRQAELLNASNQSKAASYAYRRAYHLAPEATLQPFLEQAEKQFWGDGALKSIPVYKQVVQIAPERTEWLTLLIHLYFRLWRERVPVLSSDLDFLEERLRTLPEGKQTPTDIQLANALVHAMRGKRRPPATQATLSDLTRSDSPESTDEAIAKISSLLLQAKPASVVRQFQAMPSGNNAHYLAQRLFLLGGWDQVEKQLDYLSRSKPWLREGMQRQIHAQQQTSRRLLIQARTLLAAKRYDEAAAPLNELFIVYPFSAEAYLLRARMSLAQSRLEDCLQALDAADQLGIPSTLQSEADKLKKDHARAKRLAEKRQRANR